MRLKISTSSLAYIRVLIRVIRFIVAADLVLKRPVKDIQFDRAPRGPT